MSKSDKTTNLEEVLARNPALTERDLVGHRCPQDFLPEIERKMQDEEPEECESCAHCWSKEYAPRFSVDALVKGECLYHLAQLRWPNVTLRNIIHGKCPCSVLRIKPPAACWNPYPVGSEACDVCWQTYNNMTKEELMEEALADE